MFTLVRVNVPSVVRDPGGRVVTHVNPDHVWDYVVKHHKDWRTEDVKILYMTRRHLQEDTSLIIDADVTCIGKTIRLVTPEEWEESVGPYFVAPGGYHVKDIDAEDDSLLTGC